MAAPVQGAILYAAIHRDGVLLCEAWASIDVSSTAILRLATKLQGRRTSPGWDSLAQGVLRGHKLPMLLHSGATTVTVLAVYEDAFPTHLVKGFLEKAAMMFRPMVDEESLALTAHLSAQVIFAATLKQRMHQAKSMGALALVSARVDEVKEIMHVNIETMLEQHDRIELLQDKTQELNIAARQFKKAATSARRFHYWNQAKLGLAVGTAATVLTAAIITPIIIAVI
ncbi:synaptobrevin-domain-containing protein [Pavlovales sp. CCMP2436]|nr:synaptobrevin-domain-containing protein [Pavlovales sp. CCMP2436]